MADHIDQDTDSRRSRMWLTAPAAASALFVPLLLSIHPSSPSEVFQSMPPDATLRLQPAFPGVEGEGRWAVGGRTGRIIAVTTLDDAGPGSLRACLEANGPRVCVFRVAGVIRYETVRPVVSNPYLTVAGETAPGDGIVITHAGGSTGFTPFVIKNTHDVIVRDIRVRLDRNGEQRAANSGFIIEGSHDVVLDHVSASWAQDENVGGYAGNDRITISWSIFAEGVPRHDKCALLASDPKGPQRLSFIRNLCAHNGDRNPDINFPPGSCVEVVNNVLYNAESEFSEIWESYGGSPVSIIGNYYRPGPNTRQGASALIRQGVGSTGKAKIFFRDNVIDDPRAIISPTVPPSRVTAPPCASDTVPVAADVAYRQVLDGAGAFPRDAIDRRIVDEVRYRTGSIGARNRTIAPMASGRPYGDTDGDGMSDSWERANGSNPMVPDPWMDADGDHWSNLAEFLDYAHRERMAGREVR